MNSIPAYITLVVNELRVDGHAAQHSEHAVLPKQHAAEAAQTGAASKAPISADVPSATTHTDQ